MTDILSRSAASAATAGTAWRFVLGALVASVPVASLTQAVQVARAATDACGADVDAHLTVELRADRAELTLQTMALAEVTGADVVLSRRVSDAVAALGLRLTGALTEDGRRSVQVLELAIDAMDIPTIRGFWKAVLGYADEPGADGPRDPLVDPAGRGPAIWFQQMDRPRPQRNRIHLDVAVPHDEADARVRAALAAGGVLVSAAEARAFWVLADAEGNEVCVCTWQDRD